MRDLSKSMLSFTWALSLLGMRQAVGLFSGAPGTARMLDPITETAVGQLDESMKGIFRSGDNIQSKTVDMMFGILNPANWNPMRWMSGCGSKSANGSTAPPSYASAPSTSPPTNVNATTAGSNVGWGPMPEDTSE